MRVDKDYKKDIGQAAISGLESFLSHVAEEDLKRKQKLEDENNPFGWVDILTFTQDPYYLGESITLRPWQRLILKIFYMGSDGNANLRILDDKEPTCLACVWNKNDLQGFENPCVSCKLWTQEKTEDFLYDEVSRGRIKNREVKEFMEEYEADKLTLNFLNEMQMMERDLVNKPEILNQLKRKIGKQFMELVLVLGRRSGKALSIDTPIITPKGWKTMGELQVGDEVFGEDGQPTKIIAATEVMEDRPCYEITFSNGEKIVADEQHQWNIFDKKRMKSWSYFRNKNNVSNIFPEDWYKWRSKSTRNYSDNDNDIISEMKNNGFSNDEIGDILDRTSCAIEQQYTKINKDEHHSKDSNFIYTTLDLYEMINKGEKPLIPISNALNFYDSDNLPIDPWILGYLCGDGDTSGSGRVSCDNRDRTHCLNKFSKAGYQENTNYKYDPIHFHVNNITKIWKDLGLHSGKFIPEAYKRSSIDNRISLLTGLIDSDGYVDSHGAYRFTNTNETLIDDVKELCHGLGLDISVYTRSGRERKGNECKISYDVSIRSYIPLATIGRKLEKAKHDWKYEQKSIFITNVVKLEKSVPVKCIEVDNESHLYLAGKSMIPTHNSLLTSIIALYETYKLLETGNPQEYLGLAAGDTIAILNVAGAKTQAQDSVFDKIKNLSTNSPYFKKFINPEKIGEQVIRFWTPADKEKAEIMKEEGFPAPHGSLMLMSGTSNVSSQVGKTLAVVIIDEVAEMIKNSESKMSDVQLYNKLGASIGTFNTKGKIITISNPLGAEGLLWELYNRGIAELKDEDGTEVYDPLVFQLSTRLCNPAITEKFLKRERLRLKSEYDMQYEAEFSEGSAEPWLPADIINKAFYEDKFQVEYGIRTQRYYAHVDVAINTDNFAFVILHSEDTRISDPERGGFKRRIVVDHIKIWQGTKEEPVKFSEVDNYILRKCKEFKIKTLSYDSWQSEYSFQNMQERGIPVLKTSFNNAHKAKIYETLRDLFIEGLIEIPTKVKDNFGRTIDAPNYYETKDEFLYLEKKYNSKSHSVGKSKGHNDDITDCIAGAAWVALRHGHTGVRPSIRTARIGFDATERVMNDGAGSRTGYNGRIFQ